MTTHVIATIAVDCCLVTDWIDDITGEVIFIDGDLAHVLASECTGIGHTAVMKAKFYYHNVTCYELISNGDEGDY